MVVGNEVENGTRGSSSTLGKGHDGWYARVSCFRFTGSIPLLDDSGATKSSAAARHDDRERDGCDELTDEHRNGDAWQRIHRQ